MRPEDKYLSYVKWSEEDHAYVGYCPDLFPYGGVCHADTAEEAFRLVRGFVAEEVADLQGASQPLPEPSVRVMRDAVVA